MDRSRSACQDGPSRIARPEKGRSGAIPSPKPQRDDTPIALYHTARPDHGFPHDPQDRASPTLRIKKAIAQQIPSDFRVRQSSRFSSRDPLMNSPSVLLSLLLFYPLLYGSVFLHELGHALVGRASGFAIGSFGLGTARPWLVVSVRGTKVCLAWIRPFQGITFACWPSIYPSRLQMVGFSAGGILANTLGTGFFLILWQWLPWGGGVWPVAAFTNAILGGTSLIPFQVRVGKMPLRTDGALILQVLRTGGFATPSAALIQTLNQLRGLWAAIGDTLTLRVYLLSAAGAWLELGDRERGLALVYEADTLPGACPPGIQALRLIVQAQMAADDQLDAAEQGLDSAEGWYRSVGSLTAVRLVALCRVTLRLRRGDAVGARHDLEALATDPLVLSQPSLRMSLLGARLAIAVAVDDAEAVQALQNEYEAARLKFPSAARDLTISLALGQFHARKGNEAALLADDRRVFGAIREIAGSWADPEGRLAFLQARSATIEEVRLRLEAAGHAEEARGVVAAIENLTSGTVQAIEYPRARRWGYRIMVANVIICALAALAWSAMDSMPRALLASASGFALLTAAGGLYVLIFAMIGWLSPAHRKDSGAAILLLACLPWLSTIVNLLVILFATIRAH